MWNEKAIQIEKTNVIAAGGQGGLVTLVLMSLPVVLFDVAWYWAWQVTLLAPYTPTLEGKMFFYGLCVGGFQFAYGLMTLGYGYVAIPASVISWFVLVWVL